jgi:Ca2+-binding RTX toxin-like protein
VANVRFEEDQVIVDLTVQESGGGTDDHDRDVDIADVTRIVFNGFAGQDRLNVIVGALDAGITLDGIELEFNGGDHDDVLDNTNPTGGVKTRAFGGAGNDTLEGSRFNDTFEGGVGNDTLIGLRGNDTYLFVGTQLGSDVVNEAANVDVDTLDFTNFAGGGVNVDLAVTTARVINAGDLTLRLSSSTGIENVIGTTASDTIRGNSRGNELRGLGERDFLFGREGADDLFGGAGNDDLFGDAGNDDLFGESGIDNLNGGADADTLDGGFFPFLGAPGRDQLTGGTGADTFIRHRRTLQPTLRFEDILDFTAIDAVFTVFH